MSTTLLIARRELSGYFRTMTGYIIAAESISWSVLSILVANARPEHERMIIIGGAEDKVRERVILNRFIALAGGPDARIAVISTASSLGPLAGEMGRKNLGDRLDYPLIMKRS